MLVLQLSQVLGDPRARGTDKISDVLVAERCAEKTKNFAVYQTSLVYRGGIAPNLSAFAQVTYDSVSRIPGSGPIGRMEEVG